MRDFYGITLNGLGGVYMVYNFVNNFIRHWGVYIFDEFSRQSIDSEINIEATKYGPSLWQFSPLQQEKYPIVDVPQVMGPGITAQSILFSNFVYKVDNRERSKYHDKFDYVTVLKCRGSKAQIASIESLFLVFDKRSENAQVTYIFFQWIADKRTQTFFNDKTGRKIIPNKDATWDLK